MLKETKVELELLTDKDMMLFVERGIRGGLNKVSNRYATSNNKYMSEGYNPDETDKYLMYFDVNNSYGYAMSQPLPCNGFKWIKKEEVSLHNCLNPSSEDAGYIFEVDLEYPQKYHDEHSDLPFCPEHRIPPGAKTKKLMTTLLKKKKTHHPLQSIEKSSRQWYKDHKNPPSFDFQSKTLVKIICLLKH
ncbi:hypothetical protein TKK_0017610 [Trichogramma kaykai]